MWVVPQTENLLASVLCSGLGERILKAWWYIGKLRFGGADGGMDDIVLMKSANVKALTWSERKETSSATSRFQFFDVPFLYIRRGGRFSVSYRKLLRF